MSDMAIRMGGGFGDVALPDMSPRLRAQLQMADAEDARQIAVEERERAFLRDEARESAIAASIIQARDRGEVFDLREALQDGIGRTPAEAVEYMSAMADVQDAKAAADRRRLFEKFEAGFSADTSAPSPADLEHGAEVERHALAFEARQVEARRKAAEAKATDARTIALARSVVRDG